MLKRILKSHVSKYIALSLILCSTINILDEFMKEYDLDCLIRVSE